MNGRLGEPMRRLVPLLGGAFEKVCAPFWGSLWKGLCPFLGEPLERSVPLAGGSFVRVCPLRGRGIASCGFSSLPGTFDFMGAREISPCP